MTSALLLISAEGQLVHRRVFGRGLDMRIVEDLAPTDLATALTYAKGDAELTTVSKDGGKEQVTKGHIGDVYPNRVFRLPDGGLVLFGSFHRNNVATAAVTWIDRNLRHPESALLQPPMASTMVDDAIPTGVPGEFLMSRFSAQTPQTATARTGQTLTFIQIR